MTKLNLKPTAGYLLIEPLEKEVKTASGIYLPETAGEKYWQWARPSVLKKNVKIVNVVRRLLARPEIP
jgi:co-chaperonin GroES (HSP10)